MLNLCYTSRTYLSFGAMILFILGFGLMGVAYIAKKYTHRFADMAPGAAKFGGILVLLGVLAIALYVFVPLIMSAHRGDDAYGPRAEDWCYTAPHHTPCPCPENMTNCTCIIE